mgnify:FL=1
MNKKSLILIVFVIVIVGAIVYLDKPSDSLSNDSGNVQNINSSKPAFKEIEGVKYPLAPELVGISGYLNTNDKEIKMSDYSGKVILVDFWT